MFSEMKSTAASIAWLHTICTPLLLADAKNLSEVCSILQERQKKKCPLICSPEYKLIIHFLLRNREREKSGWKCSKYFLSVMAYALFANLSCPST